MQELKFVNVLKVLIGQVFNASSVIYPNISITVKRNVQIVLLGWFMTCIKEYVLIALMTSLSLMDINVRCAHHLNIGMPKKDTVLVVHLEEYIIMLLVNVNALKIVSGQDLVVSNAIFLDISIMIVNSV